MKTTIHTLVLFLGLCTFTTVANAGLIKKIQPTTSLAICNSWLEKTLELTKKTPGYTPPVAARTLTYLSAGMAQCMGDETLAPIISSIDLLDLNTSHYGERYNEAAALNETMYKLINYFYVNASPNSKMKLDDFYTMQKKGIKKGNNKQYRYSLQLAEQISLEIIEQSKRDNADECWNKNFPESFEIIYCDSCWIPTYPGYVEALQPYWGENKTLLSSSLDLCNDIKSFRYSTVPNSELYQEALAIKQLYDTLPSEMKYIAEHWDDSPGVSGTPAGHLYSLALVLSREKEFTLKQTLQLYLTLGVALNDAIIECWRLKYKYNLIRPITYIHNHITEDFQCVLTTPPFPEFPSGHSFQAGAAQEVFIHFFGDDTHIVDRTNVGRSDINSMEYSYDSFSEMANQMSVSRFYGGIHYLKTLEISLFYGQKFGRNTVEKLLIQK